MIRAAALVFLRLVRCRRGVTAVEFALATPFLLALCLGTVDLSLAAGEHMRLTSAARAGVQYAYANPDDLAGVSNAVTLDAPDLAAASVAVSTFSGCADGSTLPAGTTTCGDGSTPRSYVSVTVSETYPFLVPFPGIGSSQQMSASATLRTE
ncbi:MAG: pilus assembly protein [Magnetospirillum sp.]|nr:pilus assembly protein [Magnetospirillum sp.]